MSPDLAWRPRSTSHVALVTALLAALLSTLAWALAAAPIARAGEGEPSWRSAPASAPPPPPGVAPASFPVELGEVGDIEFWAPNLGVLITGGDPPTVPAGLYAYNGESWHELSTVCGGAHGRIVWAGENEFWTISDERSFQLGGANVNEVTNVSLCHFSNGSIVGSYAEPFNQPGSYQAMDAGACLSPSNCWFGGALGVPPNYGAFHLHWDGANVSVVYAPQDHAVSSMALAGPGTLLESVEPLEGQSFEGEEEHHPSLLHQVDGTSSGSPFANLFLPNSGCAGSGVCPPLPDYGIDSQGRPVAPLTLGPFILGGDYGVAPPGATPQLWAVAAPSANPPKNLRSSEGSAHPIVLRYSQGAWSQIVGGNGPGGDEPFATGETPKGVAAEPGSAAAWVTVASGEEKQASVDRLTVGGEISRDVLGPLQGVGSRGTAGPIACPAQNDCWLATTRGWLFHLTKDPEHPDRTDGYPEDTDPGFAGVITYRPPDPSVPQLPPIEPPADDSLANQLIAPPVVPASTKPPPASLTTVPAIKDIRSRLVHRDTLELTFELTVKTRVQFIADRGTKVVARTHMATLAAGKRKLSMRLSPRRWPTKIALKDTPLQPLLVENAPPTGSGPNAVAPPVGSNTVGT